MLICGRGLEAARCRTYQLRHEHRAERAIREQDRRRRVGPVNALPTVYSRARWPTPKSGPDRGAAGHERVDQPAPDATAARGSSHRDRGQIGDRAVRGDPPGPAWLGKRKPAQCGRGAEACADGEDAWHGPAEREDQRERNGDDRGGHHYEQPAKHARLAPFAPPASPNSRDG